MKRRNVEVGKMRRPIKRNKITEGFYGSTLLYLKFLVLWMLVILADFILEFRFEFLWPFYLLLRSVYDSFKYQGLAFSIFFVCIALTSDMLCYFFIPVHWLFFAASTYVWVQYVWHTDKGICTPTIILWVLFVYLEAAVRLRDIKHMPGHLDLCRPFAAHCIGYPVVTLGFGFKSYIGYRIRQRKQRDVAKENEFYMQLMQQALPAEIAPIQSVTATQPEPATNSAIVPVQVVHNVNNNNNNNTSNINNNNNSNKKQTQPQQQQQQQHHEKNGHIPNTVMANGGVHSTNKSHRKSLDKCKDLHTDEHNNKQQQKYNNHSHSNGSVVHGNCIDEIVQNTIENSSTTSSSSSLLLSSSSTATNATTIASVTSTTTSSSSSTPSTTVTTPTVTETKPTRRREKKEQDKEREAAEYLQKLEVDAKRMRIELQNSRASEQDLRLQVAALTTSEKVSKGELTTMQREIEDLQQRLHNTSSSRASDKQTINNLERRLAEERRARCNLESQLQQERKTRKQEEARAAQVVAQSTRGECTEACKARRRELENELNECRAGKHWAEERCAVLERENAALIEQLRDTDLLMSALTAMQEKNAHLENSLSAETRIKLDLFSALGEAKRQLEIRESSNRTQEREIEELKSKIAQVLAVMPNDTFAAGPTSVVTPAQVTQMSRVRLAESPPGSTLDPNATAYTPKSSLVTSTEA